MKFESDLPLGASSMGQYAERLFDRLGGMRAVLEALPAAVYTTDAEGRITGFNDEAVRFSGRVPQLGTDSWCVTWKLYWPDGRPLPHDQCPMAVSLREGRPVRGVSAIAERPDGTRVHFMPYPTPIKDANGKVIGAINMLVDITEQKHAEEAQARLAAIVASSADAIYSTSLGGTIQTWNRGAEHLFGYSTAEVLGRPVSILIPEDRRAEETELMARIARGEVVVNFETVRVAKDGHRIDISLTASPIRNAKGRVVGASRIPRNITERKRSEEARARLASIVASSDDAIVSKSLDGVIRTWNRGAERMFGYTAEEAVGRHITLIIPQERRSEEDMVLAKVRRGEVVDHFETVRRAKDGRLLDISLTVSPIRDAHGQVIGASKIARDVTERKRMDAELRSLVAQLREADTRKDEFIAMLAHELRNPLSAIAVATDLLARSSLDDRKARFAVPAIERQMRQLRRLVDDLLNMARITSGKLTLRKESIELKAFAERAIADYRALVASGTSIVLQAVEAWVDADPARLKQMIENLIDNATKYGGRNITVMVSADAQGAHISVRDDGQGIAQELQASLFQPFVQGAQPTDREQRGLGLGLALVERLASLHGGSVAAASEGLGKGSTFTISLPLAKPAAASDERRQARAAAKHRVLVVEDEVDSREALKLLLETEGHEVALSDSGAAALEEIVRFRPDIALVDIGLPGMDGYEIARRARELQAGKDLKLIAITGYGGEAHRRRARSAGFDMHVVKPISYEQLARAFSGA
ncbi:MAG TPA: PAS domain S-box protein [Burkholderiales bacterium]|nr:PAS domain S-box protein [Burkholderiales bacterium]